MCKTWVRLERGLKEFKAKGRKCDAKNYPETYEAQVPHHLRRQKPSAGGVSGGRAAKFFDGPLLGTSYFAASGDNFGPEWGPGKDGVGFFSHDGQFFIRLTERFGALVTHSLQQSCRPTLKEYSIRTL